MRTVATKTTVIPATADVIRQSGKGPSQIVFISFDIDTIAAAKAALPEFDCLLIVVFQADDPHGRWNVLYDEGPGFRTVTAVYDQKALFQLVRKYRLDGIDSSFVMPTSLVKAALDAGLSFVTWTVDDPQIAPKAAHAPMVALASAPRNPEKTPFAASKSSRDIPACAATAPIRRKSGTTESE